MKTAYTFLLTTTILLMMALPISLGGSPLCTPPARAERLHTTFGQWRSEPEELTLDSGLRRPFIFFRETANKAWPSPLLFFCMLFTAASLRLAVPGWTEKCLKTSRSNFLKAAAAGFLYTSFFMIAARTAFRVETLVPMGLMSIGILQFSYFLGLGLGVNLLADKLAAARTGTWIKISTILAASVILTATAALPELGRLPRLGNRILLTIAMIGIGAAVRRSRTGHQDP